MMKTMNVFKSAIAPGIRVVIGGILIGGACLSVNGFTQEPSPAVMVVEGVNWSVQTIPLEQFTGYYQLPNKAAFILFEVRDNTLFAKKMWDNQEYQLVRLDEMNFETTEGGHKTEFSTDHTGKMAYAKILGKMMTVKVDFDPAVVRLLSAAALQKLEGIYTMQDDSNLQITIRSSGGGLVLKQSWDNKEISFTPRTETFFLNEDGTFPLTFLVENGEAVQVTCFEKDIWVKKAK